MIGRIMLRIGLGKNYAEVVKIGYSATENRYIHSL